MRPRRLYHRQCVACGCEFETLRKRTRACRQCGNRVSQQARRANADAKRHRTCETCCRPFTMRNPSAKARRGESREGRFCSRKCAAQWFCRRPAVQRDLFVAGAGLQFTAHGSVGPARAFGRSITKLNPKSPPDPPVGAGSLSTAHKAGDRGAAP